MSPRPGRSGHFDTRAILDFLEDRIHAAERRRMEEHLGTPCRRCRERLEETGLLLERMRRDGAVEVPESWRRRALELFPARAAAARPSRLRTLLARLVFDSAVAPLPAAVRRTVGEGRRLTYAIGDGALEIEIEREATGTVTLRGVLRIDQPALHSIEIRGADERSTAWPDAEGRFAAGGVPGDRVAVVVSGPSGRWRIPPLRIL